jgi:hypothetical protein
MYARNTPALDRERLDSTVSRALGADIPRGRSPRRSRVREQYSLPNHQPCQNQTAPLELRGC